MNRRILVIESSNKRWHLETLNPAKLVHDDRQDYWVLAGEALCQFLLRRCPSGLVVARGPMPFLSGNKTTVGYFSPITHFPHYSMVGGRASAQLLNLGLDAIWFRADRGTQGSRPVFDGYITVGGRAPDLQVSFMPAQSLPTGQRAAYYWLVERELAGEAFGGSAFTIGEAALLGYLSANLAVEAIYHAGRGGAGRAFAQHARALVLRGAPREASQVLADPDSSFARNPNSAIAPLVSRHCERLSSKTGGTISKLYATGADPQGKNTLPAENARKLGYALADLGSPKILQSSRVGQTGCHWCQVDCRHWHWVAAEYAPDGRDMLLDDFEPAYAIYAMLGLQASAEGLDARLALMAEVDRKVILPIEQMGCDVLDIGIGLAALYEGLGSGLIPRLDAPAFMGDAVQGDLDGIAQAVNLLRSGETSEYPALRALADGPQALADRYPGMRDIVFTGGSRTLGNAGHSNALWTFLMPFSRYFGHYVGQLYKIERELPPSGSNVAAYRACFREVVTEALEREFFCLLANALSQCAFTFIIYSQDAQGQRLCDDGLLVRLLRHYGIDTSADDMRWFAQAFWAQSIALKCEHGWQPPGASELPYRIYESLSQALDRTPEELCQLMDLLIEEWKTQAGAMMAKFDHDVAW